MALGELLELDRLAGVLLAAARPELGDRLVERIHPEVVSGEREIPFAVVLEEIAEVLGAGGGRLEDAAAIVDVGIDREPVFGAGLGHELKEADRTLR